MKLKISAADYAKEPAHVQALCVKVGEEYQFDTETVEDVTALKSARDNEKKEVAKAKKELEDTKATLATVQGERDTFEEQMKTNIPKGQVEALEKSYKDKLALAEKKGADEAARLTGALKTHLVDGEALKLATEISTVPSLLSRVITDRLTVEIGTDGVATTRVIDAKGQPSALTISDLKKEILSMPEYKAILKAGNASGGGAPANGGSGGGASGQKPANPNTASPAEMAAWLNTQIPGATGGGAV